MGAHPNLQLVERFFLEFASRGDVHLADELFCDELIYCTPHGVTVGREPIREFYAGVAQAFSDLRFTIHKQMADSTHVMSRVTIQATHMQPFWDLPATGRKISLPSVYVFEFAGDRILKIEVFYDIQTLMSEISRGEPRYVR